jgi:regulator of protease activity HflC (stomatin/prohibitin superfamily)
MKKVKNISLILLVLALLIIGSSSIVVTNENEYSLIRQFGKVDHVVSSAGVTFKIPFVQSVDKLPKEILLYDLSSSDVITSDKKTMICCMVSGVLVCVNWGVYIFAINSGHVLDASLGYFLEPIFVTAIGVFLFHEKRC